MMSCSTLTYAASGHEAVIRRSKAHNKRTALGLAARRRARDQLQTTCTSAHLALASIFGAEGICTNLSLLIHLTIADVATNLGGGGPGLSVNEMNPAHFA